MRRYVDLSAVPQRLYAIGDLHGCAAELETLLNFLGASEGLSAEDIVVFIGDYIDRGAESRQVIDLLLHFRARFPKSVFLRGNHEDMLLGFLGLGGGEGSVYLVNGGASFLESYGIVAHSESDPAELVEQARVAIPSEHVEFLRNLDRYVVTERFVLVHAGLDPLRDLYHQVDEDIYWIRGPFIHNQHHFGKTVIYGHTPAEEVKLHLPWKIGIDTGLVYGHKLSCLELTRGDLFQLTKGKSKVKRKRINTSAK